MTQSSSKTRYYQFAGLILIACSLALLLVAFVRPSEHLSLTSIQPGANRLEPTALPSFAGLIAKRFQGPLVEQEPVQATQPTAVPRPKDSLPPSLKLASILYAPSGKLATFSHNNQQVTCGVGESVGGVASVKTISQHEVTLIYQDRDFTLGLH